MDIKNALKKFWHFIWEEDSLLSWIANIILAFILIKYIIFPVLGFALGSQFPVVAVVSSSMEHDGNFDQWWISRAVCANTYCTQEEYYKTFNITKDDFENFNFKNGFNKGDVMVLTSADNIKLGDILVFIADDGRPIIHRVVKLDPLQTKGDHNFAQIETQSLNEKTVSKYKKIGKALFRIPYIGYVKILFVQLMQMLGVNIR